ncbi:MAG: hypothetical protein Q8O63_06420, partial [Hoeflea sp.]|nr:hypothetical protein [Hoeflea sp.]
MQFLQDDPIHPGEILREEFLAEYPRSRQYCFDHIAHNKRLRIDDRFLSDVSVAVSFATRQP